MKPELVLVFLMACLLAPAASAEEEEPRADPLVFSLPHFFLRTLPGGSFFPTFLEAFAPDTTLLIEESNGFSLIDPARVYFEGDSFLHFNWGVEGQPTNSLLDQGSPLFIPPISALDHFQLRSEQPQVQRGGFDFGLLPAGRDSFQGYFSTIYSDLGGYVPFAEWALAPHAVTRSPDLYETRRQLKENIVADFSFQKVWRKTSLLLAGDFFSLRRQFNDFNQKNETFDESGDYASLLTRLSTEWNGGLLEATASYFRTSRDRLFAELGRYPQETYERSRTALYGRLSYVRRATTANIYVQSEGENRLPQAGDFAKDIFDIDGEGLTPYERWGKFSAQQWGWHVNHDFSWKIGSKEIRLSSFFEGSQRWLSGIEEAFGVSTITAGGKPYQVIVWNGAPSFENRSTSMQIGFATRVILAPSLSLVGRLAAKHQSLSFDLPGNDISLWHPDFDVGLLLFGGKKTEVTVAYGRSSTELGADVSFFLEKSRPAGNIYLWKDYNEDSLYQPGEDAKLFGFTGSPFHSRDPNLRFSTSERALLTLSSRLSKRFRLEVKGLYKKIRNPLGVRFGEEYGHYQSEGSEEVYLFDQPFRDFCLTNLSLAQGPFYAQLSVRVHGQREKKWYFSFSFMAHVGMGTTAFGNGPGANDLGILDESGANPNSWIHGYGRLDGDRAFVGRLFWGRYLLPRLFLAGSLKYRDGDPFAFLEATYVNNQWVVTYRDIKAEDQYGKKGGPREDCLWDVSLQLSYEMKVLGLDSALELSGFNLLDLGSELSENVYSSGWRWANELQLPRSIRLGLRIGL